MSRQAGVIELKTMQESIAAWSAERLVWLQDRGRKAGFAAVGVAATEGKTAAERRDAEHFREWVEAGRAGEMTYLKRADNTGTLLRSSVHGAVPWARSVVLCAASYHSEGPISIEAADAGAGWIGRYAWSGTRRQQGAKTLVGEPRSGSSQAGDAAGSGLEPARPDAGDLAPLQATDYHDVLLTRLQALEGEIRAAMPCESRCYVDTGPLVERAVAARAGLGWIGKNTTVINQRIGSWTLLGSILTSIPIRAEQLQLAAPDRCGSCTRCLEACPTDALIAPYQMDARRCIAYLTIEKKGTIDTDLRAGMGRQVFGCDICQDVCPWNRGAPTIVDSEMMPRPELVNPDLEWLASLSAAEFRAWFRGSPLERTGRKRLLRNVAIAMGNSGEERFTARLWQWREGEDPVLAEAAKWALERLLDVASTKR